jgi:hypothetical protein
MFGMAGQMTYYYPKKPPKDSFQFDKGGISPDFQIFYQWKKNSLYTPFLAWQTRISEFRYPGRFQVTDQFITGGFMVGRRLYVVDHALFADLNFGISVRKLVKRRYVSEVNDPALINSLPRDKSFGNSITGTFVTDMKLHFELKGASTTFFVGLSSSTDLFKIGNSRFNEFTRRYNTMSLTVGFTGF